MTGEPDDVDAMVEPVVPSRHRWLAGLLSAAPGDRVADLGCGTGGSLAQAAPFVAGGLLAGLDLSAAALARTAEAVGEAVAGLAPRPGLLWVQADLKAPLPLADGAFDRVLCHNVLEVLPDPDALVAEAIRVLRPGGRVVLAHSDFDTLIFASEDLELTRRLVRDYCDTQQPWMDAVDGPSAGAWSTSPGGQGWWWRTCRPRSCSAGGSCPGRSAGATPATWPTPSAATAGPTRLSWTDGWPGCSGWTTGGPSCSASTTTPSSVVECPGDALRAMGATVRRPTGR
jgi:hypothetical protein